MPAASQPLLDESIATSAIATGDMDSLHRVLDMLGPDVLDTPVGAAAINFAASTGNVEAMLVLFDGREADFKSPSQQSALIAAVAGGHAETAEILIAEGAPTDILDEFGRSLRQVAALSGNREVMDLFGIEMPEVAAIEGHADSTSGQGFGWREAQYTAEGLAELEVDLTETDKAAFLLGLVTEADREGLELALSSGFTPDIRLGEDGVTLLHQAAMLGDLGMVEFLVSAGADPTLTADGRTPAGMAAMLGYWPIALRLEPEQIELLRYEMLAAIDANDLAALKGLLEQSADVNWLSQSGQTPLMQAQLAGFTAGVEALLGSGATPVLAGADGIPPLMLAVMMQDVDVIELLTAAGADPNLRIAGVPLLTLAVPYGIAVVDALLAAGADPKLEDPDGMRAGDVAYLLGEDALASQLGSSLPETQRLDLDLASLIVNGDYGEIRQAMRDGADFIERTDDGVPYLSLLALNAPTHYVFALVVQSTSFEVPDLIDARGSTVIDAALARDSTDWPHFVDRVLQRLSASERQRLLLMEDREGTSNAVKIAARLGPETRFEETFEPYERIMKELAEVASTADGNGVTPWDAVILTDNGLGTSLLTEANAPVPSQDVKLVDLAEAAGSYYAMAMLPGHPSLPRFSSLTERDALRELQIMLKNEGFYTGSIDGQFGAGSKAALLSFALRQRSRLERMDSATPLGPLFRIEIDAFDSTTVQPGPNQLALTRYKSGPSDVLISFGNPQSLAILFARNNSVAAMIYTNPRGDADAGIRRIELR